MTTSTHDDGRGEAPQSPAEDYLSTLRAQLPAQRQTLESEMRRLAKAGPVEQVRHELSGTILPLMIEQQRNVEILAHELHVHRQWAAEEHQDLGEHLAEIDDQLDVLSGDDSQLTAEDAEKFARLAAFAELSAKSALEQSPEGPGMEKVKEILALATWAQERIADIVLEAVEDEEDDEPDTDNGAADPKGPLS